MQDVKGQVLCALIAVRRSKLAMLNPDRAMQVMKYTHLH